MDIKSIAQCYNGSFGAIQSTQPNKSDATIKPAIYENLSPTDKLNSLFPNNELEKIYDNMCKQLGLDIKPTLKLPENEKEGWGGGFTFQTNEVSLSKNDLCDSDYKIVAVKNGKRFVLVSPDIKIPLFTRKEGAIDFVNGAKSNNNYGFDSVEIVPTTVEDQRRIVMQKIYHELIHAQQHMIMRQTEGIGIDGIIRAWTHLQPENEEDEQKIKDIVKNIRSKSYWADKSDTPTKVARDNLLYPIAKNWVEGIKHYPPITSPQYSKNPVEADAYSRSAEYVQQLFGPIPA